MYWHKQKDDPNGKHLLYSKLQTDHFPDLNSLLAAVQEFKQSGKILQIANDEKGCSVM